MCLNKSHFYRMMKPISDFASFKLSAIKSHIKDFINYKNKPLRHIKGKQHKFRLWVIKLSFLKLILGWFLIYIIIGLGFGIVYCCFFPDTIGGDIKPKELMDFIHFSFTTQATVGYGDYYPTITEGRVLAAVQGIIGTGLSALFLGVATFKFLKRTSPFIFPDVLAYIPKDHEPTDDDHRFWFRFIHFDADGVRDLKIEASIFRPTDKGRYDTEDNNIDIDYRHYGVVESGYLYAIKTMSNNQEHTEFSFDSKTLLKVSPPNINKDTVIRLFLSGYFDSTGDAVFAHKDYYLDDIYCGRFENIDNNSIRGKKFKDQKNYINERFNKILPTKVATCKKCSFKQNCPLKDKLRPLRETNKIAIKMR